MKQFFDDFLDEAVSNMFADAWFQRFFVGVVCTRFMFCCFIPETWRHLAFPSLPVIPFEDRCPRTHIHTSFLEGPQLTVNSFGCVSD